MPPAGNMISSIVRFLPILHIACTGTVFSAWWITVLLVYRYRSSYPRLADVKGWPSPRVRLPKVSVLVSACNEAGTVERAMRSLLAVEYPDVEIIAINDRSSDETGEILECLAATCSRLRVIHIESLPHGWLGKNHAMHVASQEAAGEWLLFTDADVVFHKDTLVAAVTYAYQRGADHLVACPHFVGLDFWERLVTSYFGLMFLLRVRPWDVERLDRPAYFGFGAFNLVRAKAYRECGGYGALPMEIVDDAKLGKVLKRGGFQTRIVDADDYLSIRWFIGFRGLDGAFMKNAFASFEFSLLRTALATVALVITALYPILALALPVGPARWLAGGTVIAMIAGAGVMRRITDADFRYGCAYPLAGAIVIGIIVKSTWMTLRQHGVVWRGTRYCLDQLRRGVV